MKQKHSTMGRLGAVLATALLTACAETPMQVSSGEYIDDTAITAQVKSALVGDEQVSTLGSVGVDTFKGIVQLSGFVDSAQEKEKAGTIARTVTGVKAVENDIRLKDTGRMPAPSMPAPDSSW